MNLKRQLLLVALLTLLLPWAGCEFIRETESALRIGQQQMLAGTARALANSLSQYREEFPRPLDGYTTGDQLYVHELGARPTIDGYFDDWPLPATALKSLRGTDGPIRVAIGSFGSTMYLYVEVSDREVVYAGSKSFVLDDGSVHADRVDLISSNPPYLLDTLSFAAEAPGKILSYKRNVFGIAPEPAISAYWQDVPGGYRVEARIPAALLGTHLGIVVNNTDERSSPATRSSSFAGRSPGPTAGILPELQAVATRLVQPGMRLLVTDTRGWRIARAGELQTSPELAARRGFSQRVYGLVVEAGNEAVFAEPDPLGREQQAYTGSALQGREMASWFRSGDSGKAVIAVAAPVKSGDDIFGAVILQQGTEAILSLTNSGLARLINVTLIATLLVAAALLGYATWLSRRIRHLSIAAEAAVDNESLQSALPSALASDEIGDLSRSFSSVLQQLGDYNEYLRKLAASLSHELRTPLAIVTSSLENLEHETLTEAGIGYTTRAREGADRLRHILNAMSEANRVEELMDNFEPEPFNLEKVLKAAVASYRDVYPERLFELHCDAADADMTGSPELVVQLLDKLVDNAVDFSSKGDTITVRLAAIDSELETSVTNPGPPLPEKMRTQMFDPMVSMRSGKSARHLGLGLYIARLIAVGHGGRVAAENVEGGVMFTVTLGRRQKNTQDGVALET